MPEHSPEPWEWRRGEVSNADNSNQQWAEGSLGKIVGADGIEVCSFGYASSIIPADGNEPTEANRRRIIACVNACKGISTETLEKEDRTIQ